MSYNTILDLKKNHNFFQNGREAGGSNNQVLKNYFIQLKYLILRVTVWYSDSQRSYFECLSNSRLNEIQCKFTLNNNLASKVFIYYLPWFAENLG